MPDGALHGGATLVGHAEWPPDLPSHLQEPHGVYGVYGVSPDAALFLGPPDMFMVPDEPRLPDAYSYRLGLTVDPRALHPPNHPLSPLFSIAKDTAPRGNHHSNSLWSQHTSYGQLLTKPVSMSSSATASSSGTPSRFDFQALSAQVADPAHSSCLALLHDLPPDARYPEELLRSLCVNTGTSAKLWECPFKLAGSCDWEGSVRLDYAAIHIGGRHLGFRFHCYELKYNGEAWCVSHLPFGTGSTNC